MVSTSIPKSPFYEWLNDCHDKLDCEVEVIENSLTVEDEKRCYKQIAFQVGEERQEVKVGTILLFGVSVTSANREFGSFVGYELDESTGRGDFLYHRIPKEKFGQQISRKPMRQLQFVSLAKSKELYQSYRREQLSCMPTIVEANFTITDSNGSFDSVKKFSSTSKSNSASPPRVTFTAGVRFSDQSVHIFGDPQYGRTPVRSHSNNKIMGLRGVLYKIRTQREYDLKASRSSTGTNDVSLRPDYDFVNDVNRSGFISTEMTENAQFLSFTLTKARDYCIEYFLKEHTCVEQSLYFTVLPSHPHKIVLGSDIIQSMAMRNKPTTNAATLPKTTLQLGEVRRDLAVTR